MGIFSVHRLGAALAAAAAWQAAGNPVIDLTQSTFDAFLKSNNKVLVEFYAPWCGHCKKLAPEYEKAAEKLSGTVPLAKVDATTETQLAAKYGVKGYPYLKWFEETRETEYDGGRTTDTIVEWVNSMTGPPVAITQDPPQPTTIQPHVVLHGPTLLDSFETAAKMNRRNALWYYVKDGTQKMMIHHKDEAPVEMTSYLDRVDYITDFFKKHAFPLFGALDAASWDKYLNRGTGLIWGLFKMDSSEELPEIAKNKRAMMEEVGKRFQGKYSLTYADTHNPKFRDEYEKRLGVTEFPAIAVHKKAGDKKRYVYRGELTASNIIQFIENVEGGRVEPLYRTEKQPTPDGKNVKVLVGSTLTTNLFQEERDVMLFITAPWCGHCKKLAPEYENVATTIHKEGCDDLVQLTLIDGVANDSPMDSLEWTGFPSIYYIKAGSREIQKYEGERNEKGIWKWIKRNASKKTLMLERIARNKEKESKSSEL